MNIENLSDLTGNTDDNLSTAEWQARLNAASKQTYDNFRNACEIEDANSKLPWWSAKRVYTGQPLAVGRFCANRVREFDASHK